MDSETLEDSNNDFNFGRSRRTENRVVVYTRRGKKKAHKSCNNNDTDTPTCSTAEATSATNLTSTVTGFSSGGGDATDASHAAVSEEPNCYDTASPPGLAINGDRAETTSPGSSACYRREQESLEGTVTRDGDSHGELREQSPYQEEVLQRGSPGKGADSSGQQMLVEPQQQQQDQEEMPLLLEDENPTQDHGREECGNKNDDEPHPGVVEAENLEKPIAVHSASEPLQRSDGRPPSSEEDPPIHREITAPDMPSGNTLLNDGKLVTGLPQVGEGCAPAIANGEVKSLVTSSGGDKIKIKLCNTTLKNDIKELRKKLELELDQVRSLVKQFESKESHLVSYDHTEINNSNLSIDNNYMGSESANIGGYSQPQPQHSQMEVADRRVLLRMNSEMVVMKHKESRPTGIARVNSDMGVARNLESRPYGRPLSIALMENNDQGIEKEKRTPKANQYYRNSEFLLGKDRLPPENTKRFKSSNGRKHSRETGHPFGFGVGKSMNRLFKSCVSLLQRLMKHKYGWVFNEPVDAKALGLIDYHDIIKHPMDLGTIKTRLAENWYKSAGEFAEDVRLVFHNAMTYNPKGQDVHVMAEQLLQIFEEKWSVVETEYNPYLKYQMYQDGGLHTPPSRRAPPRSQLFTAAVPVSIPVPAFVPATVHGPAYVPAPIPLGAPAASHLATAGMPDSKIQRPHFGRTPVPKKPKAKDPNKRDMTYDEKQRLSTNLQGLPPEKLDAIIQIIKKRNTAMSQHDDEIEVDIDSVDTETLWELDRFITNYKKSLSKNKRKAELALQARMATKQNNDSMNFTPSVAEVHMKTGAAIEKGTAPPDNEKQGGSRSGSSSSNSSSSDSGSSSSDSDSDSSSADGSDAEQRT